jgi:hypothetical protein
VFLVSRFVSRPGLFPEGIGTSILNMRKGLDFVYGCKKSPNTSPGGRIIGLGIACKWPSTHILHSNPPCKISLLEPRSMYQSLTHAATD